VCDCCALSWLLPQVTDEFKQGEWLVAGAVTDTGALPYGKLCGSRDFSYTATFGPFKNCGKKKVCGVKHSKTGRRAEQSWHYEIPSEIITYDRAGLHPGIPCLSQEDSMK